MNGNNRRDFSRSLVVVLLKWHEIWYGYSLSETDKIKEIS
jgi:hypothetical protein